jgi:galactokinase
MPASQLNNIYPKEDLSIQTKRFASLTARHKKQFSSENLRFFSSPGRTEICGNHTDHNHGKVIAAAIHLDSIAAAQINNSSRVTIFSEGYDSPFEVDLSDLEIQEREKGTTNALIRGIAARLHHHGYNIAGFNATLMSDVLPGSGLSSSASVEVLIGTIFNHFFNDGKIPAEEIAQISRFAENQYFGKPCGLMDQMACAKGNIIAIDFGDENHPQVLPINFDFSTINYKLVILDTGGNHANLTEDYAAIPGEMKNIANFFKKSVLADLDEKKFYQSLGELKKSVSHRAILRGIHFFNENHRVEAMIEAFANEDFTKILNLITASGNSSYKYLQNIYSNQNPQEQGPGLALALTENFLKTGKQGACRIHGGGFAGTIQVLLPFKQVNNYIDYISPVFGKDSAQILNIRPLGATEILL